MRTSRNFKLKLLTLSVLFTSISAFAGERYFKYSAHCDKTIEEERNNFQEGSFFCIFGYTTSYPLDFFFLPFQATKYLPEYSEGSTKTSDGTSQSSKSSSSEKSKEQVKQYKQTFLAYVAEDAAAFNASPDRTPSTDLIKAWELMAPIFPGENGHQLSSRIVDMHMQILTGLLNSETLSEDNQ